MTRKLRGFTLIEVMVALAVMTVGAMGTLALQRQVTVSNRLARRMDIATQIAETWIERLKIDSCEWPKLDDNALALTFPPPLRVSALANTEWLRNINVAPGAWTTIPIRTGAAPAVGSGPFISNAFDFQGQDVVLGAAPHAYCASFRLNWSRSDPAPAAVPAEIRAEVRVWWPRVRTGIGWQTPPFAACNDAGGLTADDYHFVQLSAEISPFR